MRVVASLTTMPDKYDRIYKTLKSIYDQDWPLDAIYLGLPEFSRRLNIPYPPLPDKVAKLCTVVKCNDYGPITKIVGGLLMEQDPDTVIITFDDDMIYPKDMVRALVEKHKLYPNSSIGSSGMLLKNKCPFCAICPNEVHSHFLMTRFYVPPEGRKVDSVYGYPGALYVRKFFPPRNMLEKDFLHYALIDNDMLMNDDIVISGYLSLKNIERRIFEKMPRVTYSIPDGQNKRIQSKSEISYSIDFFFKRLNNSIITAKELGMYHSPEPVDHCETLAGFSGIMIFAGLLVIFFFFYAIFNPCHVPL